MRRIACVALPEIRVEIARDDGQGGRSAEQGHSPVVSRSIRSSPVAVIVARSGGTVKTARDVLGGTRLDVVSEEARALGVRPGQTVAAARAKCSDLRVRVVREEAVRSALMRVAEVALSFGPAVAFDIAQDVVWVEVSGCAHLRGGEHGLAQALEDRVRDLGHACRIAIAEGPRIAAAVARFTPVRKVRRPGPQAAVANDRTDRREPTPIIVPEGQGASAVGILPLAALRLDDDVVAWLTHLGLRTCGDLQKISRRALGTRLGGRAYDVMPMLAGEDFAPLEAWRPPPVPEERIDLDWAASSVESITFVTKTLCDRLAVRLEGRAMAASRIEIVLTLEPPRSGDAGCQSILEFVLPAPVARASDLLAVARFRLEREVLAAPVVAVTLRAPDLAVSVPRTIDLLTPEPKADRALPRLVAELAADLGAANVGTLDLNDTWVPDERTRLVPFGVPRGLGHAGRHALVTSAIEPSRLVGPVRVPSEGLADLDLLARIDAVQWWRRGPGRRDLAAVWLKVDPSGRYGSALAWVEIASPSGQVTPGKQGEPRPSGRRIDEDATLRGWFD
jgi:protein ImuB